MDRSEAHDAGAACAAAGRSAPVPSWTSIGASVFARPRSPRVEDGAPSGETQTHTKGSPGIARQSAASASRSAVSHRAHHKTGARLSVVSYCREVVERRPPLLLRLKLLLRGVHPAV